MTNSTNNKNSILENLIKNQKEHIELKSKLVLSDLKRLTNNLSKDIFSDECSLWDGPILVANNKEYISYKKTCSTLPMPLERAQLPSQKGTKTLEITRTYI